MRLFRLDDANIRRILPAAAAAAAAHNWTDAQPTGVTKRVTQRQGGETSRQQLCMRNKHFSKVNCGFGYELFGLLAASSSFSPPID